MRILKGPCEKICAKTHCEHNGLKINLHVKKSVTMTLKILKNLKLAEFLLLKCC